MGLVVGVIREIFYRELTGMNGSHHNPITVPPGQFLSEYDIALMCWRGFSLVGRIDPRKWGTNKFTLAIQRSPSVLESRGRVLECREVKTGTEE
jgi:hypothetical protein